MSVQDRDIEPEDQEWCAVHNYYRPCRGCQQEQADRRADAERDERSQPVS